MSTLLERLQSERADLISAVDKTLNGVQNRDLNDAETRTIGDAKKRIGEIDGQLSLLADVMQTKDSAADLTARLSGSQKRERTSGEFRSIGEQFAASDIISNYRGGGRSATLTVEERALPTGLAEAGNLYNPLNRVDVTPPFGPTPLIDAIGSISVSQGAIETVLYEKVAGGAAIVPEKTAKPSVEYSVTVTPFTLDTIAGYTQMTRQMMEDYSAVRDKINSMLMRDVAVKMESEAAAALAGATLPTATASSLLAAIRTGVGTVQAAGYVPNTVVLNPADWADLDIDVFGSTLNGPVVSQRFWGLTPISAVSQPAGTATVGDLTAGVEHYRRSGISLYITDSHGDTFLSNVFTVLAEARAKTIVVRPDALVECSVL